MYKYTFNSQGKLLGAIVFALIKLHSQSFNYSVNFFKRIGSSIFDYALSQNLQVHVRVFIIIERNRVAKNVLK